MSKNQKRIQAQSKQSGRISPRATDIKNRAKPSISFSNIDDAVVPLKDLSIEFLSSMIRQFKVFCSIDWNDIANSHGLGWDKIPQERIEFKIPRRFNLNFLYHVKISHKSRVWGFRDRDVFEVVWFDPFHEVTPE